MRKKVRGKKGFTFLEVMISVAILSIVVLMGSLLQKRNQQIWFKSNQRRDVQQNARIALDQMMKEIKQAGCIYGNVSTFNGVAINLAHQNKIRFNAVVRDVNGNGLKEDTTTWAVNRDTETITFSLVPIDGTSRKKIQRKSLHSNPSPPFNPETTFMDFTFPGVDVENIEFEYRDSSGTVLGLPVTGNDRYKIRYISVSLKVKKGSGRKDAAAGYEEMVLKSGVSPPNLRN